MVVRVNSGNIVNGNEQGAEGSGNDRKIDKAMPDTIRILQAVTTFDESECNCAMEELIADFNQLTQLPKGSGFELWMCMRRQSSTLTWSLSTSTCGIRIVWGQQWARSTRWGVFVMKLAKRGKTPFVKSEGNYHTQKIKKQTQRHFLVNKGRMLCKNGHFRPHALESKDKNIEAIQWGQDLGALKRDIIKAVANTNRGKDTTADKKQYILRLIEALEARNPTTSPVDSPLLPGLWSLLYTAPTDEKVDKYAGAEEGPFLARLKPVSFGTVRQTASFQ
ncbi:hypothetical protein KI387_003867, partial [Taxus chinensis]